MQPTRDDDERRGFLCCHALTGRLGRGVRPVFLCDFDNTMVIGNVTDTIFGRWGPPDWRVRMKRYQDGIESAERVNTALFRQVSASVTEIAAYAVERTTLRPGVAEVVRWCAQRGVDFVVNSAGADAYIRPVLASHGLGNLRVISGELQCEDNALVLRYHSPSRDVIDADTKAIWTAEFRRRGGYVLYAGDGRSDQPAAHHANFVFAREKLLTYCRENGIPHAAFDDFFDVLHGLQQHPIPAPTPRDGRALSADGSVLADSVPDSAGSP